MSNSVQLYTNIAAPQSSFSFPFSYLEAVDITAYVDGVVVFQNNASTGTAVGGNTYVVAFSAPNSTTLTFSPAVVAGSDVRIQRNTNLVTKAVDFADGAVLTELALDTAIDQVFFGSQEAIDRANEAIAVDLDDKWNADNKIIKNVANPVNAQDAATKDYLENTWLTPSDKAQLNSLNTTNLNTVANDVANVNTVATNIADVNTIATNITDVNTVATNDANITTVAGISSDVTAVVADATDIGTVSTNITNVNTVAGISADVSTVAADGTDIGVVAGISSDVTTVSGIAANVTSVAGNASNINAVVGNATNINAVAADATDIGTVSTNIANVNSVAGNSININTVAADVTDIGTVATNITNVNTVAGIDADVTTVASIDADVTAAATNNANITTVANNISNVNSVAAIDTDVTTVAGMSSADITTVAGISANVTTVAGIDADITTVAGIATDVTAAATNASDISAIAAEVAKVITVANDLNEATSEIDIVANSIANVDLVGASITDVNTVASNLSGITAFADVYASGATDPTTNLNTGDLFFNTTSNTLKIYDGTAWVGGVTAGSGFLPLSGGQLTGNLTFSATQTVDGRDLSVDGAKLDGIEAGATADQTASELLTAVKTVDGAASGLDADLLDGQEGTYYLDANNFTNMPPSDVVGDTTPELGGNLDTNGNDINFGDNDKAIFGAGSDLQIYHSGNDSYILDSGTGDLYLAGENNVRITSNTGLEAMATLTANGAVTLYHDNAAKIATTATGVDVTGNATFDDNGKAIFGAGSDLQIFHDGSNSYIIDNGTGDLVINTNGNAISLNANSGGEYGLRVLNNGAVNLYHDNALKLATTATGVSVTGTVAATAFTGNAATASQWQTPRTLSLTGDVTGSVSVDGSSNFNITTTLAGGGGVTLPTATSDPSSPSAGDAYFNTSDSLVKVYNGSAWAEAEFNVPIFVDAFAAGGGGGGSRGQPSVSYGGGGAGGVVRQATAQKFISGQTVSVSVGGGGGCQGSGGTTTISGGAISLSASGGGGDPTSGTGGSNADYSGSGESGAYGGGNGAGSAGNAGGNFGGPATQDPYLSQHFGGGGAGPYSTAGTNAGNHKQNGSGGYGGGAGGSDAQSPCYSGGSGRAIIRLSQQAASYSGSPSITTSGGYYIYSFTGSGSVTI